MDIINKIRKSAPGEELDYVFLSSVLSKYKYPKNKIGRLIKAGAIVRIKKGLYVFGEQYSLRPYSPELLANLMYGPSYVSLDYALYYYGAIPERVETITSVTTKKNKLFKTPAGNFSYKSVSSEKYHKGITSVKIDDKRAFFIATPEKALADKLLSAPRICDLKSFKEYLFQDLRIDPGFIAELNMKKLCEMLKTYKDYFKRLK